MSQFRADLRLPQAGTNGQSRMRNDERRSRWPFSAYVTSRSHCHVARKAGNVTYIHGNLVNCSFQDPTEVSRSIRFRSLNLEISVGRLIY